MVCAQAHMFCLEFVRGEDVETLPCTGKHMKDDADEEEMNVVNYDKLMQEVMKDLPNGSRLLLHSCCAPCSSYCLQVVRERFDTTVFYYNPNLDSEEEYRRRKHEQVRFLNETGWAGFLDCDYSPEEFERIAKGKERLKEGGERCKSCFRLRLERTARAAKEHGFDFFATTLTVSPLKNAEVINEIGFALQEEVGVRYLPSDFKKRNGYMQSVSLSKEYSLYRQNYCGCRFSKRDGVRHVSPEGEE